VSPRIRSLKSFFGILSSFATSIEQCYLSNEKRRAETLIREKKPIRKLSKNSIATVITNSTSGESQGEFDRILNKMKNGQAFIERQKTWRQLQNVQNNT